MENTSVQFYKIAYKENGKSVFQNLNIHAPSFDVAIQNPENFLSGDRENIFVTVAKCFKTPQKNESGKMIERALSEQHHIPFDIDHIDTNKTEETLAVVRKSLKLKPDEGLAQCTGNGLQIFIGVKEPITSPKYFKDNRPYYKLLCEAINEALKEANLPGSADDSVFKETQVVRVPGTINRKPNKDAKEAYQIDGTLLPINFNLKDRAPKKIEDFLERATYQKIKIAVDSEGVQEGCEFLKYAKADAAKLSEPEWFTALGILAYLPKGRELAHKYSKGHPGYTYEETEDKLDQVEKNQSGPRLCESVDRVWGKCKTCPFFGQCKTPLLIKGPNFIESASRGFRKIKMKEVEQPDGTFKRVPVGTGAVAYDDFLKYFKREYPYKAVNSSLLFVFNGKHWEDKHSNFVSHVAEKVIKNETPKRSERSECQSKVLSSDYTPDTWLTENNPENLVNFQNGVLDLRTLKMYDHDMNYSFFNVFPYSFKEAQCPKTDEAIKRVLQEDPEAEEFFWRFLGACFDPFGQIQKSLFVIGMPATGKSTLAKVFESVFPDEVRSNLKLSEMASGNEYKFRAHQLYKKYVNIADEGVPEAALDMSNFKNAVSCGYVTYEKKMKDAFNFKCTAKFLVLANNYVKMKDAGKDFARKFEVLTTNRIIPESEQDLRYQTVWIPEEREGIAYKAIQKYREMLNEYKETGIFDLKITDQMKKGKSIALESAADSDEFFDRVVFTGCDEDKVSLDELYSEYKEHCRSNDVRTKYTRKTFTARLRTRYVPMWSVSWDYLYGTIRTKENKIARGLKCVKLLDHEGFDRDEEIEY